MRKTSELPMTEGEICRHWSLLADKMGGIRILAELNLVSQDDIVDILRRNGCNAKKRRSRWDRREQARDTGK